MFFFYINIFYRENKKVFRNNFIDYYNNNDNEYNIDIFELKSNFDDIIYDKLFNKTLDEISHQIIYNMINKIQNLIYESTSTELQSLYKIIDKSQIEIENKLKKIETSEIPDDMLKLNQLIINYILLVQNQNNRFKFSFGKEPFNLLNNFTINDLEPPLFLIKELYNSIEERLIEEITKIVDNFPDYYSIIKEKLFIESRLENATEILNEINSTLYEYRRDLNDDLSQYFNKLIHFAYINGIKTYNKQCNESYCMVHRRNDSSTIELTDKDVESIIFGKYTSLSFSDTKKKKNQNIDLNKKYLPNMGPLTKDDIFYYLYNIQNTLYNLNKTYLSKEYKNISRMVSSFITKVNFTYLMKLERSFEFSLIKFSTVLTEPSYEKLRKNLYKQYYQIENYINKISNYAKNEMDEFSNKLNDTSIFIKIINSQTFFRVLGYYNILSNFMQSKMKELEDFDFIRNLGNDAEDYSNNNFDNDKDLLDFDFNLNENIIAFVEKKSDSVYNNYIELFQTKDDNLEDETTNSTSSPELIFDKCKNFINELIPINMSFIKKCFNSHEKKFDPHLPMIIIPLPIFPILQLRIIPTVYFKVGYKFSCINTKLEFGAFLDFYVKGEVSLNLELGLYIPGIDSPAEIAIVVGIKGVLGSGTIGLKLEYNLNQNQLVIELYYQFEAFSLYFYIQYRLRINLELYILRLEFYIVNQRLFGLYKEKHKRKIYNFLN